MNQKKRKFETKTEQIEIKKEEKETDTDPLAAATHINRGFRSVLFLFYVRV